MTLGIGLTAMIFAIADPFIGRPLPYPYPDRLVAIRVSADSASPRSEGTTAVAPTLSEWRAQTDLFEALAGYGEAERIRLIGPQGAALLSIRAVSPEFLSILGARADSLAWWAPPQPGAPRPLVKTESIGHARIVLANMEAGNTLMAEGGSRFHVAATLPSDFVFPHQNVAARPDALSPAEFEAVTWRNAETGMTNYLTVIARLTPHTTAKAVETALAGRLSEAGLRPRVEPLSTYMAGGVRPLALGALAAALLIALVCAANVMNLTVARGVYRADELATREALGASRLDLLRLVVLELLAIGVFAVAGSLLVARVGLLAIARVIPDQYAAVGQPALTGRVTLFAVVLGVGILGACVWPTWLSSRVTRSTSLTQVTDSRTVRRFRFVLTAGQTAVAMVLLVGAALLIRSYANLWLEETGYSGQARIVSVSYPSSMGAVSMEEVSSTIDALQRLPGVSDGAAAVGVGSLLDGYSTLGGARIRAGEQRGRLPVAEITPDYFKVVGTRVLSGRVFDSGDHGWRAIVINEAFAALAWPGLPLRDIVGRPMVVDESDGHVVGIVENTRDRTLDSPPVVRVYRPLEMGDRTPRRINYALRVVGIGPRAEAIQRAVASVSPRVVVEAVDSIDGRLAETVRDRSFATLVLTLFASAGVGVTALGIFAVVAFVVARRTREIAIRIALGAQPRHVRHLVIADAALATLLGAGLGLVIGHWGARALETQLYGVSAGDLTAPTVAAFVMLAIAALAAWLPARRALRLDTMRALRVE